MLGWNGPTPYLVGPGSMLGSDYISLNPDKAWADFLAWLLGLGLLHSQFSGWKLTQLDFLCSKSQFSGWKLTQLDFLCSKLSEFWARMPRKQKPEPQKPNEARNKVWLCSSCASNVIIVSTFAACHRRPSTELRPARSSSISPPAGRPRFESLFFSPNLLLV